MPPFRVEQVVPTEMLSQFIHFTQQSWKQRHSCVVSTVLDTGDSIARKPVEHDMTWPLRCDSSQIEHKNMRSLEAMRLEERGGLKLNPCPNVALNTRDSCTSCFSSWNEDYAPFFSSSLRTLTIQGPLILAPTPMFLKHSRSVHWFYPDQLTVWSSWKPEEGGAGHR